MTDPVSRMRELLDAGERLDLISGDDLRALLDRLDAAEKARDEAEATIAGLSDPIAVHRNMLRGGIAQPSIANILHLYAGKVVDAARATAMQARCEALEAALREMSANCCPALCQNCSANRDIANAALTQEPS